MGLFLNDGGGTGHARRGSGAGGSGAGVNTGPSKSCIEKAGSETELETAQKDTH